jgi:hypothetical protein
MLAKARKWTALRSYRRWRRLQPASQAMGAFDSPPMAPQLLRCLNALAGDAWSDAPSAKPLPQVAVVVSLVGVQFGGAAPTGSAPRADRRYGAHERFECLTVVQVGTGDADRER